MQKYLICGLQLVRYLKKLANPLIDFGKNLSKGSIADFLVISL